MANSLKDAKSIFDSSPVDFIVELDEDKSELVAKLPMGNLEPVFKVTKKADADELVIVRWPLSVSFDTASGFKCNYRLGEETPVENLTGLVNRTAEVAQLVSAYQDCYTFYARVKQVKDYS